MSDAPRRLNSWKEIAEYLDRDVSTAMRWARSNGLPVRRIPGGPGRSVFAFAHEIDAWMAGHGEEVHEPKSAGAAGRPPAAPPEAPPAARLPAAAHPRRPMVLAAAILAVTAGGLAMVASKVTGESFHLSTAQAAIDASALSLSDRSGNSRTLLGFSPSRQLVVPVRAPAVIDLDGDGIAEVIAGLASMHDKALGTTQSGEILNVALDGRLNWRTSSEYLLRFRDEAFASPFGITDWQIAPAQRGARRIAVAAHHWVWWASTITVLDAAGTRTGVFANPGWLEALQWLDENRVAAAGFNNAVDAGALAVLDARAMNGQAPGSWNTPYFCLSCGPDAPLLYATFPRSEVNLASQSRFNRALISRIGDRLIVTTIEVPADSEPATALYEFTDDLKFLRARYSEAYWNWHRKLEADGRLAHPRETCPHRDGPAPIRIWNGSGWRSP